MTTLIAALASMLALTALGWLARRATRVPLCPVCIGVSGTWLGLVVARAMGTQVDPAVLGILIGASVLGITQWQAERLPGGRSALLWKVLGLATGFAAAYAIVAEQWLLAAVGLAAFALAAALFRRSPQAHRRASEAVSRLEERLKQCCG